MSTHYQYEKRARKGRRITFKTVGPSMTVQADKPLTDINNIVARFHRTGELPPGPRTPQYGDISDIQQEDPTTALNRARETIGQVQTDIQNFRDKQEQEKQKQYKEKLKIEIMEELSKQKPPENPPAQTG